MSSFFYNELAQSYESYCHTSNINTFLEDEINLVEKTKPASILEFGIGTGRFAKEYIKRNHNVVYTGVDSSQEMLRYAHNSGAFLVHANFEDYIHVALKEKMRFDCIIAPYTAIHHIRTSNQPQLLEKMRAVSSRIIINCLTKKEEEIFGDTDETVISFLLPASRIIKTTIYKVHPLLRNKATVVSESSEREYLVFDSTSDTQ